MTPFERIEQLHTDYKSTMAAVTEAQQTLRYLKDAVKRRLADNRAEILGKISRLERQISDPDRPQTVKNISVGELEKLKKTVLCITDAEKAAFLAEIEIMQTAEADLRKLTEEIKISIKETELQIATMRSETLGNQYAQLIPNWILNEQREFEVFCREVYLNEQNEKIS